MTEINEMMARATLLHRSGKMEEARDLYQQVLLLSPDFAEVLHRLGLIAHSAGRPDEAAAYLRRAIRQDERQPKLFFGLGLVLQEQKENGEAEKCFRQALALNPGYAPAYNHLGLVLQSGQRFEEALQCFREAVRYDPDYARAHNNLGHLLKTHGGDLQEAAVCFHEAVRLKPDYFLAFFNLGQTLQALGDMAGAEESYRRAVQLDPGNYQANSCLGGVLIAQLKLDGAESVLRRVLELKPGSAADLSRLAHVLVEQGKMDEATAVYEQSLALGPDNLPALLGVCLMLPPVYSDSDHVIAARQRYAEGLKRLNEGVGRIKGLPVSKVLEQLQRANFYLAYQGGNDRELQSEYAGFVAEVLSAIAPEFMESLAMDRSVAKRRLRVGFLSSFLRKCTVGSYFKSWITLLDREQFEVFVYYTGHWRDDVTREIEGSVEHYVQLIGVEAAEIARRVKGDGLDVLIYPEMGMDVTGYMLGAMRLAPVQCVAWGHPVTTGHKNMDYFISCASMEPDNASEHYTEKLVLLGGIGTCYIRPACSSPPDRSHYGLPDDSHLYLCPQSPYKIHPDNDDLLLDILEQDPQATLVFFQGMYANTTQAFKARLERGIAARSLAIRKRVVILPRMGHEAYMQINRSCDVMLDTLRWSGGNTSLDALACGLPMVTLPGEFMRGRQSCAMLTAMGLDELIARDKKDYVAIALRLGNDPDWRGQIRERIVKNASKVFETVEPIRELERFLLSQAVVSD